MRVWLSQSEGFYVSLYLGFPRAISSYTNLNENLGVGEGKQMG